VTAEGRYCATSVTAPYADHCNSLHMAGRRAPALHQISRLQVISSEELLLRIVVARLLVLQHNKAVETAWIWRAQETLALTKQLTNAPATEPTSGSL